MLMSCQEVPHEGAEPCSVPAAVEVVISLWTGRDARYKMCQLHAQEALPYLFHPTFGGGFVAMTFKRID